MELDIQQVLDEITKDAEKFRDEVSKKVKDMEQEKLEETAQKEIKIAPDKNNELELNTPPVESVIIPLTDIRSRKRGPYREQYELRDRAGRKMVFRMYGTLHCQWQPSFGRFVLRVPIVQDYITKDEWYVYPAVQFFPREYLVYNLELNPQLRELFDQTKLKITHGFLYVGYRDKRKKIVRMRQGMLWGFLYVTTVWEPIPNEEDMGLSRYCDLCKQVGHVANYCQTGLRKNRVKHES